SGSEKEDTKPAAEPESPAQAEVSSGDMSRKPEDVWEPQKYSTESPAARVESAEAPSETPASPSPSPGSSPTAGTVAVTRPLRTGKFIVAAAAVLLGAVLVAAPWLWLQHQTTGTEELFSESYL